MWLLIGIIFMLAGLLLGGGASEQVAQFIGVICGPLLVAGMFFVVVDPGNKKRH